MRAHQALVGTAGLDLVEDWNAMLQSGMEEGAGETWDRLEEHPLGLAQAVGDERPEGLSMIDPPQIMQSEAQLTAVIHLTIPREQIRKVMEPGLNEVMEAIGAQGIEPAGPWFTHHLRMDPDVFDFEIGVPVMAPVAAAGRVKPGQLPAATVARTVYHGPYEGLGEAWGEFDGWIAGQGLTPAADLWEVYIAGPESSDDRAAYRTELNRPLVA